MRILSYNIHEGCSDIDALVTFLLDVDADVVCLQETNDRKENNKLAYVQEKTGYTHHAYAPGNVGNPDRNYSVTTLSKGPLFDVYTFSKYMTNASLNTTVQSPFGPIALCNTHLSPINEENRFREIQLIARYQRRYEYTIIMGDLNTLSPVDPYAPDITEAFGDVHRAKFCNDAGKIEYDVHDYLEKNERTDIAVHLQKNDTVTVPTKANNDPTHSIPFRLDYAFASLPLVDNIVAYEVIKNSITESISDHYPIMIEISSQKPASAEE